MFLTGGLIPLLAAITVGRLNAEEPAAARDFSQIPVNTWVKLTPLADTPPSPRLGYEGACVWDSRHKLMIRYGGHNQGGGGEQNSEIWTFEPRSARWELRHVNVQPPGICCGQQNVFDPLSGRYVRFPAFSASHGWQWRREVYLNEASIWTFDLDTNLWRNLRPIPSVTPKPLRSAAWDAEHQVIVLFGGEGSNDGTAVYDPWENRWLRMHPNREPEPRSGGNLAYDPVQRQHVLFGSQFHNDEHTWTYELRTNTWTDIATAERPPTDKNDAVLTYDASAGAIVAISKISTGEEDKQTHRLETWTLNLGEKRWTRMNPEREPDPTSNRARQLLFAPELGVSLLENRPSNSSGLAEQQVWAYRLPPREPQDAGPAPPRDLQVVTGARAATLTWKPAGDELSATAVYRGSGEEPWTARYEKLATVPAGTGGFEDPELTAGTTYYYFIRSISAGGREGPASVKVRTQPRFVEDVVVSVTAANRVELTWAAVPGADVVGYHIERAPVEVLTEDQLVPLKKQTPVLGEPSVGLIRRVGEFRWLTTPPVTGTTFVDTTVDLHKPQAIEGEPTFERKVYDEQFDAAGRPYRFGVFAYRVRAVNALGVVGGASAATFTIPSSPQHLYSQEDGTACRLKWQANGEAGLRGYRVYRMDGRYDKDAIVRLTPEPTSELNFADPDAGKSSRRYYVLAVDALGQEGFPSSPVWHNREWAPFYEPFVGEWHQ